MSSVPTGMGNAPSAIQQPERATTSVRALLLGFDPGLALAVVGLAVCSLIVVGSATADDVPGDPNYFVDRQAAYFLAGGIAAVLIWRFDYSRLREVKYVLYG